MAIETAPTTAVDGLRGLIQTADDWGDLRVVEGAHWRYEIGVLTELGARSRAPKLLLFDRIPVFLSEPGS